MDLPTLDLSLFTGGNASQRMQLASDLLNSLSRHGFVKLVNHGISDLVVAQLFEWSLWVSQNRLFFQMKTEEKLRIAHPPGPDPQRGFSSVGAENSSKLYRKGLLKCQTTEELSDARQHFDQGAKNDLEHPNKWPDETILPGFRNYMEDAFEKMERTSTNIMEALEMALNLPGGAFMKKITHERNASEFRFNHYPAIDIETIKGGRVSRIWPHFDLGVITLLFQDSVGGLEFENREQRGNFQRVECSAPSEMVVNVSETLQRLTNDRLPAGLHRVNIPEDLKDKETGMLPERYSIAYFCKADREASVGSLKQFVAPGAAPKYQDITAIEYHQQRLLSAY
ncbi:hypothetical protein MMC12_008082 [Toensbergia leucococca]|nr:hypothetical protein [Toensbergia leucococca]